MIELEKKETKGVVFHTNTVVQPESWEMLGVSAKENDNPIGQFGTGFSLAIAGLLRLGHKITIYTEGQTYRFHTKSMDFRGKDFERIYCNETPLSFTTHFAFQWEPWMLYREFISNTMDEGGIWIAGTTPIEGGTSIVIEGEPIYECLNNHDDYFLGDREPIYSTEAVDIYKGAGTIFYKGVKVGVVEEAMHSYHMKDHLSITEDRTMAGDYNVRYSLGKAVTKQITDEKLIRNFMTRKAGFESQIDWEWDWSETALKVGKQLWKDSPTSMGEKCRIAFKSRVKDADFEHVEMTPLQEKAVGKAIEFLKKAGYEVECPVKMVKNTDSNLIAYHYQGEIFLTERCFDKGLHFLVEVMFEESRHHVGYNDECRTFQTYLIKEIVKQSSKALGEIL